jgi:MoxR-like ATPase
MTAASESMTLEQAAAAAANLRAQVGQAVFGQEDLITETMCALLSGGHILMTGAPGLAKTTLVRVFAQQLGLLFGRVQFTPDLLPSDILGAEILNVDEDSGRRVFEFAKGPIFTNLLLADEINRASPRTQSALLEAMQERSVTVAGHSHVLPQPFMVFATQNPFESEGTFPLPEAQLDRFLVHTLVSYPDPDAESRILSEHAHGKLVGEQVTTSGKPSASTSGAPLKIEAVTALIARTKQIKIDDATLQGIRDLVRSTRPQDELCPPELKPVIWYGAGPRAGISLVSVVRALALIENQEVVRWSHVRRMALPVLRHRLRLTAQGARDGQSEDDFIRQLLTRLETRHKNLANGLT